VSNKSRIRPDVDSTTTYQQQAYDFVKTQILNLELKPGQYITDSQVAEALGTSRTPAREALSLLAHEGLLISETGRGWKVYTLSIEDIQKIFELKENVEGMMVRKAARCEDEELRAALRDVMEQMKHAATIANYEAWRQADDELHRILYAMCDNRRACDIVQNLNDQWLRLRAGSETLEGRMERSTSEHEAVVKSILDGDADEAERQMQIHIGNVKQALEQVMRIVLPFMQEGV